CCSPDFLFRYARHVERVCKYFQAVITRSQAVLHGALDHEIAGLQRLVDDGLRERGFTALLGERDRAHGLAWIPRLVESFCGHDSFGRDNLPVHATHAHFVPVGMAPHIAIAAAHAEVDFADRHRPVGRPQQPLPHQFRLTESLEHQAAGRREGAGDDNLAVAASLYIEYVLHRVSPDLKFEVSSFSTPGFKLPRSTLETRNSKPAIVGRVVLSSRSLSSPRAAHRDAGTVFPRTGGSARANCWLPRAAEPPTGADDVARPVHARSARPAPEP